MMSLTGAARQVYSAHSWNFQKKKKKGIIEKKGEMMKD